MKRQFVTIERQGRIAIVRFSRRDGVNALSRALITELIEVAASFQDDAEVSAVVLTGDPTIFTAGFDLKDAQSQAAMSFAEKRVALTIGPRLCRAWEEIEAMTFMAIEGWCIGGGAALVVAGDIRVAGAGARFYIPEIERGMSMSWGSLPRLVNLVGPAKAKRLVVMAEKCGAERALDWGLADEVAEDGKALDAALAMAERVAAMPPVQVRMCKLAINAAANALNQAVSALDRDQYMLAQSSDDFAEGVRSFMEKRPPNYTGN
jgi:enoyl-CoA hydratase